MPRKPFLVRLDEELLESLQRWAADDLRSLNGQIEFLLSRALREAARHSKAPTQTPAGGSETKETTP